jgi:hypothetical protein
MSIAERNLLRSMKNKPEAPEPKLSLPSGEPEVKAEKPKLTSKEEEDKKKARAEMRARLTLPSDVTAKLGKLGNLNLNDLKKEPPKPSPLAPLP